MNKKFAWLTTGLMAAGILLAACVPITPVPPAIDGDQGVPLEGTQWGGTETMDAQGAMVAPAQGSQPTAIFQDGSVGGTTGCNNYFGSYTVDGNQLTVSQMGSTMMACEEPLMTQEADFLAALGSAATYTIDGNTLQIADAGGNVVLTFAVIEPTALVGPTWVAVNYNNGNQAVVGVVTGTELTAIFGEDGSLSGSAGCNNMSGSYSTEGNAIQIGPIATTRMMCSDPEGIMEQEAQYTAALMSAATYSVRGDQLELRTADDAMAALFVAQAAPAPAGDTTASSDALSPESLANMSYQVELVPSGTATLEDGYYSEEAAPGSASKIEVTLLPEYTAYGELDGLPAAGVILTATGGGSGTFYYLAVVEDQGGTPVNVATTLLGDRVMVQSVAIENNTVYVDMLEQAPGDPMCCPTQQAVNAYQLLGDQLVEVPS